MSAPQLRKVDLMHRVGAQCRRSTPAALQLADVDFSQPAAADTSNALAWAVPRQLVDRAITSKPPELADGRSVHPPGMDAPARPVARPERVTACNGRARQGHRGFGSFFAWYLIFARLASCSDESRDIARLGNMLTRCPLIALTRGSTTTSVP